MSETIKDTYPGDGGDLLCDSCRAQPVEVKPKHTPGPWKWTGGVGLGPQLEGNVKYPEMNPILLAIGCGNDKQAEAGVAGCMPENLGDPLRACPLHPTAEDRALIASSPTMYRFIRKQAEGGCVEAQELIRDIEKETGR